MTILSPANLRLLRLPFSFFLTPLYFFALGLVPTVNPGKALLVFFILHFLVYPASNAYNSYMDQDKGPIGGLEKPPPATRSLYYLTIVLDLLAILLSFFVSIPFAIAMPFYIGASKAYSYRRIRLKKYPIPGYLTVILFQGAFTFFLVYMGSNMNGMQGMPWQGPVIASLLIGGFYPLTQVYQHKQDVEDGVQTISYILGYRGTFIFCAIIYGVAWVFMAQFFIQLKEPLKLVLLSIFFMPIIVYFFGWFFQVRKNPEKADFKHTMRMNWLAATCTNLAFIILLIWKWLE